MTSKRFYKLTLTALGLTLGVAQLAPSFADTGQWNNYLNGGVNRSVQKQEPLDAGASQSGLVSGDAMSAFTNQQGVVDKRPVTIFKQNVQQSPLALNSGLTDGRPAGRTLSVKDLNLFSKNDIAILIDKSWSMGNRTHEGGMKRWDWCRNQLVGFTSQTAKAFPKGIDVLLFDDEFVVYQNVDMNAVKDIFAMNKTGAGTNIDAPLQTAFDEHFKRRSQGSNKNLVVIIISDISAKKGMSVIKHNIGNVLRQNEISVTYLNLKTSDKEKYMPFATTSMPIRVEQVPWEQVNSQGLTQTILNVIKQSQ
ncbi:hypothetical protein KA183_04715 [bacterium]|nr:hypothetical protein [bacterium]QQR56143.1 MAG: hypothetical protein IPG59_14135 [Candidatus Melainabacteria bacterium]